MKNYIVKYQYKNEKTIFASECMTLENAKKFLKEKITLEKDFLKGIAIFKTI